LRAKNPIIHVDESWDRVNRRSKERKIVYFILGDRGHLYDDEPKTPKVNGGRSRILYIGMTEKENATQPFLTLRRKAAMLWSGGKWKKRGKKKRWGLKHLEVRYISPQQRQNVSAADELETACLHEFAQMFHSLPLGNDKPKWKKYSDKDLKKVFRHFPPYDVIRPLLVEIC